MRARHVQNAQRALLLVDVLVLQRQGEHGRLRDLALDAVLRKERRHLDDVRLLPALLPEEDGKDHAVAPAVHVVPADVVHKVRGAVRLQLLPVHGHDHALRLRNRTDPRVKAIHPHEGDLLVLEEAAGRLRLLLLKVVGKAHAVDVFLPVRRADGLQGAEGPVQAVDHVHAADLDVVGLARDAGARSRLRRLGQEQDRKARQKRNPSLHAVASVLSNFW